MVPYGPGGVSIQLEPLRPIAALCAGLLAHCRGNQSGRQGPMPSYALHIFNVTIRGARKFIGFFWRGWRAEKITNDPMRVILSPRCHGSRRTTMCRFSNDPADAGENYHPLSTRPGAPTVSESAAFPSRLRQGETRETHGKNMEKNTCSIHFDTTSCNFGPSQSCHTIFSF
jgi:hypothetical protein